MPEVSSELHIVVGWIGGMTFWRYYIDLNADVQSRWIALDGYTPSAPTLSG